MSVVNFHFKVKCNVSDEYDIDELGEELALFLRESFFNGEDVFEVTYVNSD